MINHNILGKMITYRGTAVPNNHVKPTDKIPRAKHVSRMNMPKEKSELISSTTRIPDIDDVSSLLTDRSCIFPAAFRFPIRSSPSLSQWQPSPGLL